jgi:hypothetical protein
MNHTPRNKQCHIGGPSLWADEPADDALPLLEGALREDEPSDFWFDYRTLFAETSFVSDGAIS